MTTDKQFDEDYIQEKRGEILRALAAEGIEKEDLAEMTPDEVLTAVSDAMINSEN